MTDSSQTMDASSWRKEPVQVRSREAERSLARAARSLLAERPYAEIKVEEVARRAGVSVGGYYGRFRGKSALLHLADMDFLDQCLRAFDKALPEGFPGAPPEIIRRFVGVMVEQFGVHRRAILQAWQHAGPGDSGSFRQRATAFNDHVHGRLRRLLGPHQEGINHPDPAIAVNMTIFFASSAARDAVLRDSLRAYPVDLTREELVDEIVRAALRYLTGEER